MKFLRRGWMVILLAFATIAIAGEVRYEYDDAGRLRAVTYPAQVQRSYTLDAAGNRIQVQDAAIPGVPGSITVPSTNTTGSYSISWAASTGTVTAYLLYEATNSNFTGETQVYSGTATSASISGKGNGSYYYRVRACNGSACSAYRTGGNATTVTLPPGVPASITVPSSSSTGSYSISWGTSSGTLTAYELWEATASDFSNQTKVYSGTNKTLALTRATGTYYYRVRGCNGTSCSAYRTGTAGIVVIVTPGAPASITVPASSTGSVALSWAAVSGTVTAYELYESTSSGFGTQTLVYSGTATSQTLSKANGTYYYRVRACNQTNCSAYRTGGNSTVVVIPAGVPPSISVPSSSLTGSFTISWGTSTGTVTGYQLWESTGSNFSGETQAYSGTGTSVALSRANGTYYYRVRACNGAACSGFQTGGNATAVTITPGVPTSITVPATSSSGNFTITWGGAACCNEISRYELYEATNTNFSGAQLVHSDAAASESLVRTPGTYYYRVRACYQSACSDWRTGGNALTVTQLSTVSISDVTINGGGYYPDGATAYYMLDGAGNILATPGDQVQYGGLVDVGDWLSPKSGMGDFRAIASASCSGLAPIGIFNTWRPLNQGQAWGAGTTGWNTSGSCVIAVTIGTADGLTIVGNATITISLWAGE